MAILEVNNLKKVYTTRLGGNQVEALKNLSFSVEEGEYVAIMGESGSGKTTLLNILAALDKPTGGQVILNGKNIVDIREKEISAFRRENLGFVFQDFNLLDNFSLKDMKGKTIIGGRIGGMPEMTLEWILTQNGIDVNKDITIDTSIAFASMSGAFIGGTGDFVSLFEPNALQLEKQGYGYVVASLGELGGVVPYTAYNTKVSYLESNPEVIEGFTKAIQKGLDYTHSHSASELATVILDYFPDTSKTDLEKIIQRYKDIDSWFETTYIDEENFNHIQEIAENAGQLSTRAPYDKLVNNKFSKIK